MAVTPLRFAFPSGSLLDAGSQELSTAWRGFFMGIYNRQGGANGVPVQAALDAEAAARTATDATLTAGLNGEATARESADTTEAAARASADTAEQTARVVGDAALQASKLALPGGGVTWTAANGAPTYTAPRGSLYSRLDGAVGSTLYVTQGAGVWAPVAGV